MENSANDTYLIVNRADTSAKHIAYRNALYATLCDRIPGADFSDFSQGDVKDSKKFRAMIDIADDAGYTVYQLTRL
jgi:hypothetical protein